MKLYVQYFPSTPILSPPNIPFSCLRDWVSEKDMAWWCYGMWSVLVSSKRMHPCSDSDMLWRLINYRIIIIFITKFWTNGYGESRGQLANTHTLGCMCMDGFFLLSFWGWQGKEQYLVYRLKLLNSTQERCMGTNTCPHPHPRYYFQHCLHPCNCHPSNCQTDPQPMTAPVPMPKPSPSFKVNWNMEKWEYISKVQCGSGWRALVTSRHCCNASFYCQTCMFLAAAVAVYLHKK